MDYYSMRGKDKIISVTVLISSYFAIISLLFGLCISNSSGTISSSRSTFVDP